MWYIVSASYDEKKGVVVLKIYNPETFEMRDWIDDSGFLPYLFTDADSIALYSRKLEKALAKVESVKKYDALNDKTITLTKASVYYQNQLNSLRKFIPEELGANIWEDKLSPFMSFIYDNDIKMGMPHIIKQNKLIPLSDADAEARVNELIKLFKNPENIIKWARIMEYPAPRFKRLAIDAEILNDANRIPDPQLALQPIICICCIDDKGRKVALVLDRNKDIPKTISDDVEIIMFFHEEKLLEHLFTLMKSYPFIITFNGDDFDLQYIKQRALNLGFKRDEIPIERQRNTMFVKHGIHIDLYKFFGIRAIQIYSFQGKYENDDLDTIGKALLNKGKIHGEHKWVGDMTLDELITYCFRDAEITIGLTTFRNHLVMNLILVLSRISRLPLENVSRLSISNWIKSYMYYDHRKREYLIPNSHDLIESKGTTATKAMIKGKKYKGAIVVEPVAGVFFTVGVVDFQSLYPTILKMHNLGYQTIDCPHEECKHNIVPTTPHWVCSKNQAIESIFVGSVRDLRVLWYKQKSKDKSLTKSEEAWYSAVEQSLKVIMNASYGVFGAESFVLYCPPVAESVTAYGRHSINKTANKATKMDIRVLYGDTDSLFLKDYTAEQIKQLKKWAESYLMMDLDLEKTFKFVCLSKRKKNYFGVKMDGTMEVKGMTGKKKHTPKIIREGFNACKKILTTVNTPEEFNQAKNDIKAIIYDIYKTLKRRSWASLNELAFHYTMSRGIEGYEKTIPQHVRAAIMLRDAGFDIASGQQISFIKTRKRVRTKRSFKWGDGVKPLELATNEDVNVNKYIEFLRSTFEQLLDPMDIDFNTIIGITKLDSFI